MNSTARYSWSINQEDSLGHQVVMATDTFVTRVTSISDTVGAYSGLLRMEAFSIPHNIGVTRVWYKPYPDSLVEVAYSAAGATPVVLPKRSEGTASLAGTVRSSTINLRTPLAVRYAMKSLGIQDSIIERSDKRIVYRYPLSIGAAWVSFEYPFLQTRQVDGYELVSVGDQTYLCAKILTKLPTLDPDLEWFDYVSSQGLIKRTLRLHALTVTENDPEGMTGEKVTLTESLMLMN